MTPGSDYHFTVTASGEVVKEILCERCEQVYFYRMTLKVSPESMRLFFLNAGGIFRRYTPTETETLQRLLDQESDPVPCPGCGWYQSSMVALLRGQRHNWLVTLATIVGLPLTGFCFVSGLLVCSGRTDLFPFSPWLVGAILAIMTLVVEILIGFQRSIAAKYDPNVDTSERIRELARLRVLDWDVYERMLRKQEH